MENLPKNKKIILFDGVCNLCNDSVLTIIKYDKKNGYVFASLQSEIGSEILKHIGVSPNEIDSIILYEPKVSYDIKSTAALKIMSDFGGLWSLSKLAWLFPVFFRDFVYDVIAKNRYQWFGKKAQCMIPTPELRSKFLD